MSIHDHNITVSITSLRGQLDRAGVVWPKQLAVDLAAADHLAGLQSPDPLDPHLERAVDLVAEGVDVGAEADMVAAVTRHTIWQGLRPKLAARADAMRVEALVRATPKLHKLMAGRVRELQPAVDAGRALRQPVVMLDRGRQVPAAEEVPAHEARQAALALGAIGNAWRVLYVDLGGHRFPPSRREALLLVPMTAADAKRLAELRADGVASAGLLDYDLELATPEVLASRVAAFEAEQRRIAAEVAHRSLERVFR